MIFIANGCVHDLSITVVLNIVAELSCDAAVSGVVGGGSLMVLSFTSGLGFNCDRVRW